MTDHDRPAADGPQMPSGMNTETPRGVLDLNRPSGTSTFGMVLPSNSAQSFIPPSGSEVREGTLIYDHEAGGVRVYRDGQWSEILGESDGSTSAP